MRKTLPYLGASLSVLVMGWSAAAKAQDAAEPFKDLDKNHWAYQAVIDLQQKGILLGYPGDYFKGKRTLTRYEFAIALRRLLDKIPASGQGPEGPAGPAGAAGPQGEQGPPGMTPEEVAELKRLTGEFKNELAALGTDVKAIQRRLDAMAKDIDDIKNTLDKMPKISAGLFFGVRSDQSRNGFADYSGAVRFNPNTPTGGSQSLFSNVSTVHDFHLGITGKLSGGVKANIDVVDSNYLSYRGNSLSGGAAAAYGNGGLNEVTTLYKANLDIPLGGADSNTHLIVGRYQEKLTPLTYYRPDFDEYFDVPWYDDGAYVQDGIKLNAKFGSANTTLWAASHSGPVDNNGNAFNAPFFGTTAGPRQLGGFNPVLGSKPFGTSGFNGTQIAANQSAGLHVGVPLGRFGELGVTAIYLGSNGAAVGSGLPYSSMVVYGANLAVNPIGRIRINAEGAKSVTQSNFDTADGLDNEDNNAYKLNVGYASGPIAVNAGYQYIDPRYSAPGYWLKIGNWYNPTNVAGPFGSINYNATRALSLSLRGDYLSGARNRNGLVGGVGTGLGIDDNIGRVKAGLNYKFSNKINAGVDYEGVFWDLSAATSASGTGTKPIEQYLTFGTGLNLAGNTVLKMAYQIINFQDHGGFGSTSGTSNASVFTTQVSVKF